jgi:dUTP pyrophosphatase
MTVNFMKLTESAQPPHRATQNSAGADLRACLESQVVIKPNSRVMIPTGIAAEIPAGYGGFLFIRSSVGKRGIALANSVGVIDADYRGEIGIVLFNLSQDDFTVKNGDRIAQLVILPVEMAEFVEKTSLSDTVRGKGGFGSTG